MQRVGFPVTHQIDVLRLLVGQSKRSGGDFVVVQIGANDGRTEDPIHEYITKFGWRGLLVEPIPALFERLKENYRGQPGVSFENCAIAPVDGTTTLYRVRPDPSLPPYTQQLASFSRAVILKQRRAVPRIAAFIEEIQVPAVTLASLFRKHAVERIDLLQVDTEGYDYEILKMLMRTPIRPAIVNFESTHLSAADKAECAALLAEQGYRYLTVGRDTIARLEEGEDRS